MIITLVMFGGVALVCPIADTPVIDDWTYAWSVEHFLTTGRLRLLDYTASYPFAQIAWAVPFAAALGFSFDSLRLSTLVMAWLGLLAFFLTLRVLDIDRALGILATLALLYNPVFFVLSLSFMTDVPFVSAANMAILGYVSWAKYRHPGWLCLGGAFAVIGALIRQIGVLLPLVPVGSLLLGWLAGSIAPATSIPRGRPARHPAGRPWPRVDVGRQTHGVTSQLADKAQAVRFLLSATTWLTPAAWLVYLKGLAHAASHLALVLAPFALWPLWRRQNRWLSVSATVAVLLLTGWLWHIRGLPILLELGAILSWDELGAYRHLLRDARLARASPARSGPYPARCGGPRSRSASPRSPASWSPSSSALRRRSFATGPPAIIAVVLVLQLGAIEALWFYYDRYYLPLLPGLIYLVFAAMPSTTLARVAAAGGVALLAGVSISGAVDSFRFNAAVADARRSLLAQGIALSAIDAGYPLNGWWLYAHPENLPAGSRLQSAVPLVTGPRLLPYKIATGPLPSYAVIEVVRWPTLWATTDRLYVLRRSSPD